MSEDYYKGFDYYNAEPPRESAAPPPKAAAVPAPEDEYNEQVHISPARKKRGTTIAAMLALSGLAVSFMSPGTGMLPSEELPAESTVIESTVSENGRNGPESSAAVITAAPTPTPSPAPTPVPLPTEDLKLKLDSFVMYPLDKGYLAEIKFTLATNSGIELSSVTGAIDADLYKYEGYDSKTKKVKSHREDYHQDFTVNSSGLVTGTGVSNTEKQYTAFVNVPVDANSEDFFSVTLTVSNTLNGDKTENKTVSLKDIALWNNDTDTYVSSMAEVKAAGNAGGFELTVIPDDGITIKGLSIAGIDIFAKKGTAFLESKDCRSAVDGNRITISSKKKKIPASGDLYYKVLIEFEVTDSSGTVFTGKSRCNGRYGY